MNISFKFEKNKIPFYQEFLSKYGFLHFSAFFEPTYASRLEIEFKKTFELINNKRPLKLNGVPVIYNYKTGFPQRVPFFHESNPFFLDVLKRLDTLKVIGLIDSELRLGVSENNGLVASRYNGEKGGMSQMGWHTDTSYKKTHALKKDSFFNIGLHLDETTSENGCLRVIPKTHKQSLFYQYFRKAYFISKKEDEKEVSIETNPGDLTIHNGMIWHRVSKNTSMRRVLYVNAVKGDGDYKDKNSKTPFHLELMSKLQKLI